MDSTTLIGHVSQSSQWAPFNPEYAWLNTSANLQIYDPLVSELNTYQGGQSATFLFHASFSSRQG